MANNIDFDTFPANEVEALAMLYLKNQDLSDKLPSEIHTMYWEAKKEIQRDRIRKRKDDYEFNVRS